MRHGLLGLLGFFVLTPTLFAQEPAAGRDSIRALEQQIRTMIERVEPSVVAVVVSHLKYPELPANEQRIPGRLGAYAPPPQRNGIPFVQPPQEELRLDLSDPDQVGEHKFGSGLVLNETEGWILTNYHLIDGATKIYVRTSTGAGCYADIRAADARSDLAVLKMLEPPDGMKPVRFAPVRAYDGPDGLKATVFRGMFVVGLGHPLALGVADGQASASWGIISNIRRRSAAPLQEAVRYKELHRYGTLLQTDARVALGSSGGGLFDLDGRVIGITSPLAAVTGADTAGGFAIPIDQNYRRIIEVLKQGREVEYGFLGVALSRDDQQQNWNGKGLLISAVTAGSPAFDAGLAPSNPNFGQPTGDVITAIDGQPVRQADDLFLYVGAALAGTKIRLTVQRANRTRDVDVTLAKFYHPLPKLVSKPSPDFHGLRVDYSSMRMLKNQDSSRLFPGVMVRSVEPGSAAATKFRPLGNDPTAWLVTHVDNKLVRTPAEFYEAVSGKAGVQMRVMNPSIADASRERVITIP